MAGNPLWLFVTWARVCRRANKPSARPVPPFALDLRKIRGQVPNTVWQEWKELTCVTFDDTKSGTTRAVFAALAKNRTRVHAISLDVMDDMDLAGAAPLNGLARIERTTKLSFITDAGLRHSASLSSLQHLDLGSCKQLTDAGLVHLSGLPQLQHLDLSGCRRITDAGLVHLSALRNLKYLNLNQCDFSNGLSDAGLVHLSGLHRLEHLDLSLTRQLTNAGLVHLSGLHQLKHLGLSTCGQLTNAGLAHISGLCRLEHLDLSGCRRLTDAGLVHLSGLHQLKNLDLSCCRELTDAGLVHVSGLPRLECLYIGFFSNNRVGLVQLAGLRRRVEVDPLDSNRRGVGNANFVDADTDMIDL